jgi:hypothetical protein
MGVTTLLALAACSHTKTLDPDELRSDLTQAISLASETETFVDYVLLNRSTANFARGHLGYLQEEAGQFASELSDSSPQSSIKHVLPTCAKELASLADALGSAQQDSGNPETLRVINRHIAGIRRQLEEAKASL